MKISKVPLKGSGKKLPIRNFEMFEEPYANVVMVATKNSGKTTLLYNILKEEARKGLTVILFASTINHDPTFTAIIDMLRKKGCIVKTFDHFINKEGVNLVEAWTSIKDEEAEAAAQPDTSQPSKEPEWQMIPTAAKPKKEKEKKEKKLKFRGPETIMVFDDLSSSLRDKALTYLLTRNRHYKTKIFISCHSVINLDPKTLEVIDVAILFPGQSYDRVQELANKLGLHFTEDKKGKSHLHVLYDYATSEKYNFLYVDRNKLEYRHNMNKLLYK